MPPPVQDPQDRVIGNWNMNLIYSWHSRVPTVQNGVPVLQEHSKYGQAV
jgi:hypothetical protein